MKEREYCKVSLVYLHEALHWPGFPAERTVSTVKIPGLVMHERWNGIQLEAKDKKGKVSSTIVPYPAVANFVLDFG